MNIKHKALIVLSGAALMGGLAVAPAMATADHGYGSQPGYDIANNNTPCAGHGAFGAFGQQGDVSHDLGVNNPGSNGQPGASNFQHPGTNGATTAQNNSSLCGNEATPPPFTP